MSRGAPKVIRVTRIAFIEYEYEPIPAIPNCQGQVRVQCRYHFGHSVYASWTRVGWANFLARMNCNNNYRAHNIHYALQHLSYGIPSQFIKHYMNCHLQWNRAGNFRVNKDLNVFRIASVVNRIKRMPLVIIFLLKARWKIYVFDKLELITTSVYIYHAWCAYALLFGVQTSQGIRTVMIAVGYENVNNELHLASWTAETLNISNKFSNIWISD